MNSDDTSKIFICSYCEQSLKFRIDQEGRRIQCPKCKKPVWVFDNRATLYCAEALVIWMYERPKLLGLLGTRMVGPISDTEFLGLVARGEIDRESFVQSPELTKNQEVAAGRVNISIVREMCSQREAEEHRLRNVEARENQQDAKNRETLLQGIKKAISDGNLSLNERTQLHAFASKTGITEREVEELLKQESSALLKQVVEDALSDGFFDDQENENISKIAIGLGLTLEFTRDQQFRLSLARIAWNLLQQLQAEVCHRLLSSVTQRYLRSFLLSVGWDSLGSDHYLKSVGAGVVKRIDKNLLLDGRLTAKKYTLSSIVGVQWYSDGLFLKRSSGKSLFIRPAKFGLEWHQFAMSMEVIATGEPVIGVLPDESFIPATEFVVAEVIDDTENSIDLAANADSQTDGWTPSNRIPRFTFRVVGESFENRQLDLSRLLIGEAVYLIREPQNPYDSNAVAVVNRERRVLGYLKRG